MPAESHQQSVLDHEGQAQRQLDHHQQMAACHRPQQEMVDSSTGREQHRKHQHTGDIGVERIGRLKPQRQEHRQRQKVAVREVDDAGDVVGQPQAQRDQRIGAANQHPLHNRLNKKVHGNHNPR